MSPVTPSISSAILPSADSGEECLKDNGAANAYQLASAEPNPFALIGLVGTGVGRQAKQQ